MGRGWRGVESVVEVGLGGGGKRGVGGGGGVRGWG